ncbi:sigma 54-interacting transcriptional regulator [Ectothiorhodospira variabilis]|nr:sigma 54-interacting transcriptional regulator [Ectothiorhodospira variabilis]MCG5497919.1 sigma 54-interacting transcriptional regulator [Ectothiorhodospira variabilis]MCG5504027.1 sigma 54-interacting transcriptional regulator [Ectothiorhodospira variabilis]MCG5507182.1 sigma 54-interacting transcriptional regulator [Ectothiorhodospira variabilis]
MVNEESGLLLEDDVYRMLFAHGAQAMLIFDPWADRILDANGASATLLGRSLESLPGLRMSTLHPRHFPRLLTFTQEVLECGKGWTDQLEVCPPDGACRPVEYNATRIQVNGRDMICAVLQDLRARRRQHALHEAEDYMRKGIGGWRDVEHVFRDLERENRLILGAAGEGIYGVNAEGMTTFVNPAAERLLGWRADEMVGRNMHELVHHTHPDGTHYHEDDCPIYAAFREGVVHRVDDEVFWRKDGTPMPVEYTSTPILDRGVVVGAVVVFRDMTRRKEAEEQLHAALHEVNQLRQRLELENAYLQEEIRTERAFDGIIGNSPGVRKIVQQIELVAPTDANVLIIGESGTGKELIAHAIHNAGSRCERPMIRVNCAAIPGDLFESEFFGHVRGAFTGALRDRIGRFELADGGTLFLDEVGEIPLELQGKLLRVLQDGQIERIGEERTRHVDVRVIAATNRDLEEEVRRGRFRQDLYFRLNVFPVQSVPLRERPDDIPALAVEFVKRASRSSKKAGIRLTQGDIQTLMGYDWPGNVRELENVIERAVILSHGGRLRLELPSSSQAGQPPCPSRSQPEEPKEDRVLTESQRRQRDRENILAALEACAGKVFGKGGAAELMGIPPTTLSSRMKTLGICKPRSAGCEHPGQR